MQYKPMKTAAATALALFLGAVSAAAGVQIAGIAGPHVYAITAAAPPNCPRACRTTPRPRPKFFDPSLRSAWMAPRREPYDFLVQGFQLEARRHLDRGTAQAVRRGHYLDVAFSNQGRAVRLNFIVVNGPDGWVISDIESPHDSLRAFLVQHRN